jgi:hypothetical protein
MPLMLVDEGYIYYEMIYHPFDLNFENNIIIENPENSHFNGIK